MEFRKDSLSSSNILFELFLEDMVLLLFIVFLLKLCSFFVDSNQDTKSRTKNKF